MSDNLTTRCIRTGDVPDGEVLERMSADVLQDLKQQLARARKYQHGIQKHPLGLAASSDDINGERCLIVIMGFAIPMADVPQFLAVELPAAFEVTLKEMGEQCD